MSNTSDVLTTTEAARELGLSVSAVRTRLIKGTLRGHHAGPRLWLIPRAEIERAKRARVARIDNGALPDDEDVPPIVARLNALRERLSQGHVFSDSAEILRQVRDERTRHQLESADQAVS